MKPPIFDFNDQRESIVDEVSERVCSGVKDPLFVLNDAAYQEIRRLGSKGGPDLGEWRALARSLGKMGGDERKQKLRALVRRYAWDVAGGSPERSMAKPKTTESRFDRCVGT